MNPSSKSQQHEAHVTGLVLAFVLLRRPDIGSMVGVVELLSEMTLAGLALGALIRGQIELTSHLESVRRLLGAPVDARIGQHTLIEMHPVLPEYALEVRLAVERVRTSTHQAAMWAKWAGLLALSATMIDGWCP